MSTNKLISDLAIERRAYWISEIEKISESFSADFSRLRKELGDEVSRDGAQALLDHLRLSGDIPEQYEHDSSEEKLYSKYTDALLSEAFNFMGFRSAVLTERGDAADVDVFAKHYSFVADAKAFRMSRTAKNQKDFKVQAMDGWKKGKEYAMVVCPIYHLPAKESQIYGQAISRNVCIFTYSHLAVLVSFKRHNKTIDFDALVESVLRAPTKLATTKNAASYWAAINKAMLSFDKNIEEFWEQEKVATIKSIEVARNHAIGYLAAYEQKINRLSHSEALAMLKTMHKFDSKIKSIKNVSDNQIFRF